MATNLEHQADAWHLAKYGDTTNLPRTYRKLCEEVGELGAAIMVHDSRNCFEEIGDIMLLLRHILRAMVGEKAGLNEAMAVSLNKAELRRFEEAMCPENK